MREVSARDDERQIWRGRLKRVAFVVPLLFMALIIWQASGLARAPQSGTGFLPQYRSIHSGLDFMVAVGDGESYAAIARDPAFTHSSFTSNSEAAWRGSRPLWGWLAFIASAGQSRWTLPALLVLETLSLVGLVYWCWPRLGAWSLALLFLPGVVSGAKTLTPEAFGTLLALLGMTGGWGWFVLAGLTKEVFLIFPLALFLKTRKLKYLVPLGAWAGWVAILRLRYGAWPWGQSRGSFGVPFHGIAQTWHAWDFRAWIGALVLVVAMLLVVKRYQIHGILFIGFAGLVTGQAVWAHWQDFTRVLLPVTVLGVLSAVELAKRNSFAPITTEMRFRAPDFLIDATPLLPLPDPAGAIPK